MSNEKTPLPWFDNPPLIEVVISVQFEPIQQLQAAHIGLLWSKFKQKYPRCEQHTPVDQVIEQFDNQVTPNIQLEFSSVPPTPRCWFLNNEGTELIQVQSDRFMHNWRKTDPGNDYPRYEKIRAEFVENIELFYKFLEEENLGELKPNQCEISYINHIVSDDAWQVHSELGNIFPSWNTTYSDDFLCDIENIRLATQHVFYNDDGKPWGRLHTSIHPAFRKSDHKPLYVMSLIARGRPDPLDINGILKFIDKGREMIVRGFTSATSTEMHKIWRRNDA